MSTLKPNWTVALVVVNTYAQQQAALCTDDRGRKMWNTLAKQCDTAYTRGYSPREVEQDFYDAMIRIYWKANEQQPDLINRTIQALNAR